MLFKRVILFLSIALSVSARAEGDEYASDPNIYELTPSNFDKVIQKTNYTSIVKFYAPWCGYCQQLKPAYKKLGKYLHQDSQYAVNVAAVNCDKDYNKPLCAQYKISGFPTVMVFRPPKHVDGKEYRKNEKHASEVYNGERSLKAMVQFLNSRLKNYVKKIPGFASETFNSWTTADDSFSKVILLTKSQQVSPLLKSLAIDFLNSVKFGMISSKSLKGDEVIVDGKEFALPKNEDGSIALPALFYYDKEKGELVHYKNDGKLNDKKKISQWVVSVSGATPAEGPLSKKEQKYYYKYRTGKKAKKNVEHDEL
ncbi:predicted protein [Scheffersomyces stipitis CBS 6054]|uniref:Thioredoxin domain-containing protein n=1 Tax=Scheffersomyces stipitis (strain ATCC 58785 / CBS 6054 / NBRC 10063 / NRRL Y-11545) TaxID=322104 RepID=A3LVR0_PICST|nr:predicted protein [Scheffersomyces stipitis CBS 6054]ABN66825.2 predicted protein [Scheffersomyces stipitis CBS 6054]KAG2734491.1 hypothetical protein G9P44_002497 [Scheffersomyces stipitis]